MKYVESPRIAASDPSKFIATPEYALRVVGEEVEDGVGARYAKVRHRNRESVVRVVEEIRI